MVGWRNTGKNITSDGVGCSQYVSNLMVVVASEFEAEERVTVVVGSVALDVRS